MPVKRFVPGPGVLDPSSDGPALYDGTRAQQVSKEGGKLIEGLK